MESHAGAHLDELQHGGQKSTETSVTEFCYKSVNLDSKFPEISHFFLIYMTALLALM